MRDFRIRVLRRHIDKGVCGSTRRCGVALGLREAGFVSVSVSESCIRAARGKKEYSWDLPEGVSTFIKQFDGTKRRRNARKALKPFTFHLERNK